MVTYMQKSRAGFTLVEIMIVVAIIALLAAIAVPSALRARKRSQATTTLETLRMMDTAVDQWAIENGQSPGATPLNTDVMKYVKVGTKLYTDLQSGSAGTDALGNAIPINVVDTAPQLDATTFGALSDVAPSNFWGPYYPSGS
jgi:prepilin-type N-terminal cleavage/methylation domain-containing protein